MEVRPNDTALVVIDPQNDFLSPKGVTWGLVGESVQQNRTVEHIEQLFKGAKSSDYDVFISPHYYYPTDHGWKFGGTVEKMMHEIKMFDREGNLTLEGFRGSGADWLEQYKPYIEDGKTIITSPHKVYGPESNDLALQLRKRRPQRYTPNSGTVTLRRSRTSVSSRTRYSLLRTPSRRWKLAVQSAQHNKGRG
jgi:nicotinamidase-related amidase